MKTYKIVDLMAQESLLRCFKVYGIEGTEQKINEICKNLPKLKEVHLRNFKLLIKGVKNV